MAAPINPKGAKSDKIWRDAIMRAVRRLNTDEPPKDAAPQQRLEVLADMLVTKGMLGDVPALREIGDRLDGKAMQPIGGDADNPIVHRVLREIFDPAHSENTNREDLQTLN